MNVRDRLIIAVVAAIVVVGAFWVLVVSPERGKVSDLSTQIATEKATLASAQAALASARSTASGYVGDVHAISEVTTAVPPRVSEAQFITLITKLAGSSVNVHQLDVSGASVASASGATSLGMTFTFKATYASVESMLAALDRLTATDGTNVSASGRLVTINSVTFQPLAPNSTTATVTAEVYSQSAMPTGAGATGNTGATPTQTTGAKP